MSRRFYVVMKAYDINKAFELEGVPIALGTNMKASHILFAFSSLEDLKAEFPDAHYITMETQEEEETMKLVKRKKG